MRKTIIALALSLLLCTSALLVSCTDNSGTSNSNGSGNTSPQTDVGSDITGDAQRMIDDARRMIEDATEYATHGIEDGTPGGHSERDGGNMPLFPNGK